MQGFPAPPALIAFQALSADSGCALDRVGGALIGAGFAGFPAFEAVRMLLGMPGALGFAFAANLRAEFAKAGMPGRTAQHCRGGHAADVRAIEANESAVGHLRRAVPDIRRRAFIARLCAKDARVDGGLHLGLRFCAHEG